MLQLVSQWPFRLKEQPRLSHISASHNGQQAGWCFCSEGERLQDVAAQKQSKWLPVGGNDQKARQAPGSDMAKLSNLIHIHIHRFMHMLWSWTCRTRYTDLIKVRIFPILIIRCIGSGTLVCCMLIFAFEMCCLMKALIL